MAKIKVNKDKLLESVVKKAEGFYYTEEVLEYAKKESKKVIEDSDNENDDQGCEKNVSKKSVSKKTENKNGDVYSDCKKQTGAKNITSWSDKENESEQGLVLFKKKITTHYVPPDMSALKILLENFGQEMRSEKGFIEDLSDEDLLKMKAELLRELEKF